MQEVRIPQNIRVADKLIGPFSLKQMLVVAAGGGVSFMLFSVVKNTYGGIPAAAHSVIWLPVALTIAFTLIRINDIPLARYVLLVIEMMSKPRQRVFYDRRGLDNLESQSSAQKKESNKKEKDVPEEEVKNNLRIEDLSTLLDKGGSQKKEVEIENDETFLAQEVLAENDARHEERVERVEELMKDSVSTNTNG